MDEDCDGDATGCEGGAICCEDWRRERARACGDGGTELRSGIASGGSLRVCEVCKSATDALEHDQKDDADDQDFVSSCPGVEGGKTGDKAQRQANERKKASM
jgi:hypothetical protein